MNKRSAEFEENGLTLAPFGICKSFFSVVANSFFLQQPLLIMQSIHRLHCLLRLESIPKVGKLSPLFSGLLIRCKNSFVFCSCCPLATLNTPVPSGFKACEGSQPCQRYTWAARSPCSFESLFCYLCGHGTPSNMASPSYRQSQGV